MLSKVKFLHRGVRSYFRYIKDDESEILLPFTTQRIGIILVTDLFFHGGADSIADSLLRLSFLIHEARHSDGIHFDHVPCPDSFLPIPNCDNSLNGSHGLESEFLNFAIHSCHSCSREDRTILQRRRNLSLSFIKSTTKLDANPSKAIPDHDYINTCELVCHGDSCKTVPLFSNGHSHCIKAIFE